MGHRDQVGAPVSLPLLVGFTVAATGGPLALVALNVPGAVASRRSIGLVVLLATAAFVAPAAVWFRYSERIASSGGLFSFVEAAVGRRAALAQGAVWAISYALYLPYTVAYIVYDLLPVVFPGIGPHRWELEVALPVVLAVVASLRVRQALYVMAVLAAGQLVVLVALLLAGRMGVGAVRGSFAVHGAGGTLVHGSLNISLLYVCSSLPLFLGGEVVGGGRTVRRGLVIGLGTVAVALLVGSLVWTHADPVAVQAPIPGMALAQSRWGHGFGTVVGLGVVASTAGVILAEFVALARLLHAASHRPLPWINRAVAVGFVVGGVLSLIDPNAFYDDLLKPSLVALWISQIIVVGVYPWWAARNGSRRAGALTLATGATALMGYGLYSAITLVSGS